ncbi:branched-chain amino acid ABC transporter permease [Pseudomonas aeruginosa]|uniref:branched-chain amino acid ABC transporter permease n=1 Tax=Pseudomonas aeruginosa TaxID=287 RepID=UPI0019000DB1|nr:branched-chain amino acid ABC transporter permease [Pseudomonas aeruginosa]
MTQTTPFKLSTLVPVAIILLLALVPFWGYFTDSTFYVAFYARVLIYAIAVVALNIALGFGGLVSLGHALFMGIGAYSVAIPSFYGIDSGWVHLFICLLVSGLLGYITGAISLRTTGIGFIMITLAFAQMGYFLFVSLKQYGGDDGTSIANTSKMLGLDFLVCLYRLRCGVCAAGAVNLVDGKAACLAFWHGLAWRTPKHPSC